MPARWFSGGRDNLLGDFRKHMLTNSHLAKLFVFPESKEIFPSVEIKAGLCYYLYDASHVGACQYSIVENGIATTYERELGDFDVLIRNPVLASIVKKVINYDTDTKMVDSIISSDTPFGIGTKPQESKKYSIKIYDEESEIHSTLLYYIVKGHRTTAFVNRNDVKKNVEAIDSVKVLIPEAGGSGNDPLVLGKPEIALKNSVCSQSYLYALFASEEEAENFVSYLKTKLFRALVSAIKISQHAHADAYRFVPMQDFSRPWTDAELYKKDGLADDEIAFVEAMIKPME